MAQIPQPIANASLTALPKYVMWDNKSSDFDKRIQDIQEKVEEQLHTVRARSEYAFNAVLKEIDNLKRAIKSMKNEYLQSVEEKKFFTS